MRKTILRYGGVVLALIVAAFIGLVWSAGTRLAEPARRPAGDPPEFGVEAVEIATGSGGITRGWFHASEDARGAVSLLHGVRSSRHSMIGRARFLAKAGYSVILVDLQAHGESDGDHITFGHLEARDVQASLEFLRETQPGVPLGVIGTSLGGAAALLAPQPLGVDALVLEAVYPDVRQAISNRLRLRLGPIGSLFTPLLAVQLKPRLGVGTNELRPIDRINLIDAPVLVIAGQNDRRTTIEESRALFEAAREPKEFWAVAGASHVDFHRFDREQYEDRVLRFLDSRFGRRACSPR